MLNVFVLINERPIPNRKNKVNSFKSAVTNIVDSVYFDILTTAVIFGNLGILMIPTQSQSNKVSSSLASLDFIFSVYFIFECSLKIYIYGKFYFFKSWNILDLLVANETFVSLYFKITNQSYSLDTSILRVVRIGRILKLLKRAQTLNKIFSILLKCIPAFLLVFFFYFLTTIVYVVLGMNFFFSIKYNGIYDSSWNFDNFFNGLSLLFRILIGTGWKEFADAFGRQASDSFNCQENEFNDDDFFC